MRQHRLANFPPVAKENGRPHVRYRRPVQTFDWLIQSLVEPGVRTHPCEHTTPAVAGAAWVDALVECLTPIDWRRERILEFAVGGPVLAPVCRRHEAADYWALGELGSDWRVWAQSYPEFAFLAGRLDDLAVACPAYFTLVIAPSNLRTAVATIGPGNSIGIPFGATQDSPGIEPRSLAETPAACSALGRPPEPIGRHDRLVISHFWSMGRLLRPDGRFIVHQSPNRAEGAWQRLRSWLDRAGLETLGRRGFPAVELLIGRRRKPTQPGETPHDGVPRD